MSALLLALLAVPSHAATRVQWLMGTACEITAYGARAEEAVGAAFAEIARWDRVMSLYKENSELSALNREAGRSAFRCSQSLWEALAAAEKYWRQSRGAFDPAYRVRGGFQNVILDHGRRAVRFARPDVRLDLGGIGKGIALDHAARVLKGRGVKSALLNFGGQIYALGAPPGFTGWSIVVPGSGLRWILRDASAATSGNGERPGHIIAPATGRPVMRRDNVTMIARAATEADAWDTALFVLGAEAPEDFEGCVASGPDPARDPRCKPYLGD